MYSRVPKPEHIDACPCCLDEQLIHMLLTTRLREIDEGPLTCYAESVFLTSGSESDFRYFLPRILDLSIQDRDWWPCREIVLRKLSDSGWNNWSETEINSLLRLFEAVYDDILDSEYDPGGDIDEWICGLSLGGINITPYLNKLLQPTFENALIDFFERNSKDLLEQKLWSPFWDRHEDMAAPIIAWFNSEEVQATIRRIYEAKYK